MSAIRIVQYFELLAFAGNRSVASSLANANALDTITLGTDPTTVYHRYQNYFVNKTVRWPLNNGPFYAFAPFRTEGTTTSIGGDNTMMQVLFPNVEVAVRLVEQGDGNRLSRLTLTTVWLNANDQPLSRSYQERYIGVGAAFSETTIELRFRSAMDSVGAQFPARKLSRNLVGILPMSADISLR
jgi:hypothetical protein